MAHANRIVHARLDAETRKLLDGLRRRTGQTESELIRRAVRALALSQPGMRPRKIVGLGRFASGTPDLASNEAHLRDFGRK